MGFLQKIITKTALILLSTIITVVILITVANYYLISNDLYQQPVYSEWTLDYTDYSPRYIYWSKDHCKLNPNDCHSPLEHILVDPIKYISTSNDYDKTTCTKFLFLGDSFTIAPWTHEEDSWMYQVLKTYTEYHPGCVEFMKLATGGAGNDQELARLLDAYNILKPDIVIWQFCQNDILENLTQELYKMNNTTIVRTYPLTNSKFLAGYLNQKVPFVRNTALGKYLMYAAETQRPFFKKAQTVIPIEQIIQYNEAKVPLLIKMLDTLAVNNSFQYFLTLVPLECEVVVGGKCDSWIQNTQDTMRKILQADSHYISMERSNSIQDVMGIATESSQVAENLFASSDVDKNPVGQRHLSPSGNIYYGKIFSSNLQAVLN